MQAGPCSPSLSAAAVDLSSTSPTLVTRVTLRKSSRCTPFKVLPPQCTVMLCVEPEHPAHAPEGFSVQAGRHRRWSGGAHVRLLPMDGKLPPELFPPSLSAHERANLLFAVDLAGFPISGEEALLGVSASSLGGSYNVQSQSPCADSRSQTLSRKGTTPGRVKRKSGCSRRNRFLRAGTPCLTLPRSGHRQWAKQTAKYCRNTFCPYYYYLAYPIVRPR
ncbi:hypothetical protein EDB89DRAFT_751977 [Lactarius sanguifluus]|nr:hypothetical protein EDB89DRAFT_751977 [Lactarius sanguifluus]